MNPSAPPSTPERLGDFLIEGILGEGGSSIVYAARSGEIELALKVIQSEGPVTDSDRARFLTEADRMKRVVHPSIVPLVGAGFLPDGRPWIAMPRLRGAPLADRTASPIAADRALPLFFGVAHGVAALHAAGLVHRDIKPQNIFWIDPEDRLILLDLGIAREIDASPSTTTRAGFSRGTLAYMAPERLFGRLATVRTDVYELTLVLVVMLLGKLPWEEGDPHGRVLPQLADTLIPAELVPILSRALSLDIERRPASVGELLEELGVVHVGLMGARLATAATELVPTPRPVGRAPTPASPGATLASTPMPHAAIAASIAPAPLKSSSLLLPILLGVGALGALVTGALVFLRPKEAPPPAPRDRAIPAESIDADTTASSTSASASVTQSAEQAPSAALVPSSKPSTTAIASVTATSTNSAAPNVTTSSTSPTTTVGAPAATKACAGYVALMCDPKTGATAAECTAAKTNSASWTTKLPPSAATETCQAAFDASKNGLALRREWKPPQN